MGVSFKRDPNGAKVEQKERERERDISARARLEESVFKEDVKIQICTGDRLKLLEQQTVHCRASACLWNLNDAVF